MFVCRWLVGFSFHPKPLKGLFGSRCLDAFPFISFVAKRNETKKSLSWLNSQTSAVDALPVMRFACALELRALLKVVVASSASNRTHDGDGVALPRCLRGEVFALRLVCLPLVGSLV